jgi:hypothetical protein
MRNLQGLITIPTAAQQAREAGYDEARERTVRDWVARGELPSLRLPSGIHLVLLRDVIKALRAKRAVVRGHDDAA